MIQIRRAEKEDVAFIAALEKATFSLPESESAFSDMLAKADHILLVATEGDQQLGYIGAYTVCRESDILTIAVLPAARGRGIGSALLSALMQMLKDSGESDAIFLEVRQSNTPARALYTSLDFTEIGVRRGYYQNPKEDAILYKRIL